MTEEKFFNLCKYQFSTWKVNLGRDAFEEMRKNGITTVGEFHYFHHNVVSEVVQNNSNSYCFNSLLQGKGDYAFDRVILKAAEAAGIRIVLLNTFYK